MNCNEKPSTPQKKGGKMTTMRVVVISLFFIASLLVTNFRMLFSGALYTEDESQGFEPTQEEKYISPFEQSFRSEIYSSLINTTILPVTETPPSQQPQTPSSDDKDKAETSELPQKPSSEENKVQIKDTAQKITPEVKFVYPFGLEKELKIQSLNNAKHLSLSTDPHLKEVIWAVQAASFRELEPLVNESIRLRTERSYSTNNSDNNDADIDVSTIDPGWNIFFFEFSDFGGAEWAFEWMKETIVPLVGWKRLHFITRSAQLGRKLDLWSSMRWRALENSLYNSTNSNSTSNHIVSYEKSNDKNDTIASRFYERFDEFLGNKINFTRHLGVSCASIQKLSLESREDIEQKIQNYVMEEKKGQRTPRKINTNNITVDEIVVRGRDRTMDIRTFWNKAMGVGSVACKFRNYVSEFLNVTFSKTNVSVNIEQVGFRRRKGRKRVHDDYAEALLTTKIIVLAQRDNWEDHYRTMEALLGGALVFMDPQLYFPDYIEDGVNVVVYNSFEDLKSKLIYYLNHPEERFEIALRGRKLALNNFRYRQVETLFLALDDYNKTYVNDYGLTRLK
mmetsp:Transcript_22073/g.33355  ORF Transcript_22073/g.33355 Transcript_22073/m.33355 type:complete len:564 (-) Transcript_22073:59-1750(-)